MKKLSITFLLILSFLVFFSQKTKLDRKATLFAEKLISNKNVDTFFSKSTPLDSNSIYLNQIKKSIQDSEHPAYYITKLNLGNSYYSISIYELKKKKQYGTAIINFNDRLKIERIAYFIHKEEKRKTLKDLFPDGNTPPAPSPSIKNE
ncbi:MAG: hypothetical protein N4A35_03690 [Flavobacteriales bacterium]|jgi:hypothetical protein|nr:hypothetical protein [Flavobacteriales bacterium]